jgi:lactate dehydrogenase-like 2-hydroxyacid dehydrogenase
MTKPSGRLRFAIYDCPAIVSKRIAETLQTHGHKVLFEGPLVEKNQVPHKINAVPEADIWIAKWTSALNGAFLREFHPRKGIITASSGTGHIDNDAMNSLGLKLVNCPTFSSNSVAEHAMALAFTGLYGRAILPPLSASPVIFSQFSDDFAEQAVAQILMRVRQMNKSINRAKEYDYRRLDEPWSNEELRYAKIGIIGRDSSAVKLARILHDGFECSIFGYDASESLAFHGVEPMFITDILDRCDYVFMCTDRYGFQVPPDSVEDSLERGIVDSRALPAPDVTISDSNVAILGTGGIGSIIARIAIKGFKCKVSAYSRSERQNLAGDGVIYHVPDKNENALANAVSDANFIFISAKLPKGTPPLISQELLGSLSGRERVIVNVARDDMVASEPLYELLCKGGIMSYATDVLPNDAILWSGGKPDDMTKKYMQHSSVVPTPHEGDCSKRSLDRLVTELLVNINVITGNLV